MSNWKTVKLSELGTIVGGATPSTSREEYYNGDIPWLTPKDLAGYSARYISRGERNISKAGLDSCSAKMLPKGTVLFSSRAPIGYVAIAQNDICTNQGFKSIVPNADVNPLFLYYLLKYNKEKIEAVGSGTTFKEVSGATMRNIEVCVPVQLSVQTKIVHILDAIDSKLENNNKINENLQQQAFALFEQLMLDSDNTECQLSDIAYLNPKRSLPKNQLARCIDMSQLSTTGAFPSGWEMKPFNGGMRFTNGDTLLARITPCLENGKTAYINFLADKEVAFGSTEYIVLAPKAGIPSEYLYCLARYPAFVDFAVKNMNGSSGRQRVTADIIGQFVMKQPSNNTLKDFGSVVSPLFKSMRSNFLENLKLTSLREALLPKLMSGEVDVSNTQL